MNPGHASSFPSQIWQQVVDHSTDAIYLIAPEDGQLLYANLLGAQDLGYEMDELLTLRVQDVQTRVLSTEQWKGIVGTMRDQGHLLFRGEHQRKDGSVFPVEVNSRIQTVNDREIMVSMVRDMSGWEAQEKELQRSETRFATILHTMGEGVLVLDKEGTFTVTNEAFSSLTGITREQIEGSKPIDGWSVIHEDGSPYPGQDLPSWKTLNTQQPIRNDVQGVIRPDGNICWLLANSEPLITLDTGEFEGVLVTLSNITDLKKKEAELERQAQYDALTGHPNRLQFQKLLTQALDERDEHDGLSVLFIDMDNFKTINDNLGHDIGDHLLRAMADRLSVDIMNGEQIARLGGDEFIAFIETGPDTELAGKYAGQIIDCLKTPFEIGDQTLYISCSIGLSTFPRDGRDSVSLIKNADIAMYRAKGEGRNRFRHFSDELVADAKSRMQLSSELRHAINQDHFELHFQPIIDLKTQTLCSAEALLRWQHPERGLLMPEEFMQRMEDTGMIVEAGHWVLNETLATLARLRAQGHTDVTLAVNVSVRQFHQPDFYERVRDALVQHSVPGSALVLEVTEHVIVDDVLAASHLMDRLRMLGVSIALDDFGTGYSSLLYLKKLPVQRLKIDKSFIDGLPGDPEDMALSRTIIGLAHNLDLGVVAEGIQNQAQLKALLDEGAQYGQGNLFSPPLEEQALIKMLRQRFDELF